MLEAEARGRDLLVSAQTGSGKTVAFGLALAATLLGEAERFDGAEAPLALVDRADPRAGPAGQPRADLALSPSRRAGRHLRRRHGHARASSGPWPHGCHIVVGTPGRLRDHIERGNLDLSALRAVVLDEADEMLDLGFREDLEFILDATPTERRTLLFSATIAADDRRPGPPLSARRRCASTPLRRDEAHGDIEYRAIRVAPDRDRARGRQRAALLRGAAARWCSAHTREAVRQLHGEPAERGFSAVALSGELTQNERSHALQALRDGRARVCVATDVAARGLDLPDLGLVIHADLPNEQRALLHRSGRTGRAGGRASACSSCLTRGGARRKCC